MFWLLAKLHFLLHWIIIYIILWILEELFLRLVWRGIKRYFGFGRVTPIES